MTKLSRFWLFTHFPQAKFGGSSKQTNQYYYLTPWQLKGEEYGFLLPTIAASVNWSRVKMNDTLRSALQNSGVALDKFPPAAFLHRRKAEE